MANMTKAQVLKLTNRLVPNQINTTLHIYEEIYILKYKVIHLYYALGCKECDPDIEVRLRS